jgi:threonine/homoserine/homoserine lactone efflux protein
MKGLLTNLANPKAIIYFGSVFSLFVGDSVGAGARWGIFMLITLETSPGLPSWQACSPYRRCAVVISVWRSGLTVLPVRCSPVSVSI